MKADQAAPIRELYQRYLRGAMSFDELMAITDRRLAEFDARYPIGSEQHESPAA